MEKEKKMEIKSKLVFAINGERFEVDKIDPSTTLLEYLRTQTRFKGTKLSCGEGGCGACVVLLSKYDPVLEQVEDCTVSSCLTLLCSINGCSVTTTEGLGNSKDGFHSIHKRFAAFHASQCGFCTPGMCMSLFSALVNAEKTQREDPPSGFSKLTTSEAEKSIGGHLCRCTGYRPIADACKSFAADVDMEDLGLNSFWRDGDSIDVKLSKLPSYDRKRYMYLSDFLKSEIKSKTLFGSEDCCWYSPDSVDDLENLLDSINTENGKHVKLVVGNTSTGYYKELQRNDIYIDLRNIPELSMIKQDSTGIEIGAAVTISKAIQALAGQGESKVQWTGDSVFNKVADHMNKVGSEFIRNTASLGGNLILAQRKQFPSDIATILLAADSLVDIQKDHRRSKLTLEEFLEGSTCDSNTILLNVGIPHWEPVKSFSSENTQIKFETYRAAPRPLGNALPFLNAAFMAQFTTGQASDSVVLEKVRLVFGAYGTKHAIRAKKVEEFLTGKSVGADVLFKATHLLRETIVPDEGTSSPAYRSSLAVGFLFDFFRPLLEAYMAIPNGIVDGYLDTLEASEQKNTRKLVSQSKNSSLLLSGKQVVEINRQYHPVGEPTKKSGAEIQASGEAVFVDDIPPPKDCLYGAFIYSTRPLAWVKGIGFRVPSLPDGVLKVISYKDIPEGGENVGSKSLFGSEPLFADDLTRFAGQPVGFVVADTQKHADMAANLAVVDYDTGNLEPPILSVEEAVERSSFFEVPPFLKAQPVGDFSKGMAEADHKILSAEIKLGSQYYFYMEAQTALAIPDEDNCMVIYSSSQCPESAGHVIARCLGVPEHNVRVITRRVGGGFGGKAFRAMPVSSACALAAHKLRRPVRIYLNRKTDMIMAGGRHPMKINYSVGFKSNGKITALHLDILVNAGISEDISPIMPHNMSGTVKKYNWGALSFDIKVCKTNHSSKSAMRAPGEVQASYIAEAVIEHVASFLSMEVNTVRNRNIHTVESLALFYKGSSGDPLEYTLPSILEKLVNSSNFHERVKVVESFNICSKWRKRGISCVPIVHEVMLRPTPGKVSILGDGSVVVEVGGIELGQGLWTKVKQMTAFSLSSIGCEGSRSLLERVRVLQSDTLSVVQGGFTAGSTTSEASCEAVRLCCNALIERLIPLKEHLLEKMGVVLWDTLISQATMQAVNLSSSTYYVPDVTSSRYLNYGAAVSEVEIDLLTGATTILQTDIIYDCGQSLNPAVDLGQFFNGYFFLSLFSASGEPPLLLAISVHCATRDAVREARKQFLSWSGTNGSDLTFQLDVPATMPVVKELCGLDNVDRYLQSLLSSNGSAV
ncbi:hypothetical protein IFM89_012400 [Coptis chinensis]|uniref:Uncharacterized protein n=1 Tax=Coptis chinensis TaxID=261450 RepID=A0A835M2D3_9MAGN|nr:hypothetical protein IFM89_012400 [Coptis chinensis]